jgi:hypothetical protein
MKKKQLTAGIIGAIFLLGLGGCNNDGGSGGGGNVGANEVNGKTFFQGESKTVFAGSTFEAFEWDALDKSGDYMDWEFDWVTTAKGSYNYNGEKKTVTATIGQIMWEDAQGRPALMNKTQAQNAVAASADAALTELKKQPLWVIAAIEMVDRGEINTWELGFEFDWFSGEDPETALIAWLKENENIIKPDADDMLSEAGISTHEQLFEFIIGMSMADYKKLARDQIGEAFNPRTFAYEFAQDGSILGQQVLPANKGTDELKGKTYADFSAFVQVEFAAGGNTYTIESYEETAGTYAYDSTRKTVWLKPVTKDGATMAEYWENVSWYDENQDKWSEGESNAAQTNSAFAVQECLYDPEEESLYSPDGRPRRL